MFWSAPPIGHVPIGYLRNVAGFPTTQDATMTTIHSAGTGTHRAEPDNATLLRKLDVTEARSADGGLGTSQPSFLRAARRVLSYPEQRVAGRRTPAHLVHADDRNAVPPRLFGDRSDVPWPWWPICPSAIMW